MFYKFKSKLLLSSLAAAAIACTATMATAVAAPANVAVWVKNATKLGTAPANQSVTIALHMGLKNTAGLKALATAVSSPASAEYGRYLTTEQFGQRFAPASAEVAAAKALLEHAGMTHVQVGPHGVYVSADATVDQLRKTFRVSQDIYAYQGMTLRANREEPTLPAALAGKVIYVEGLDESTSLRHPFNHSAVLGKLVSPADAGRPSEAAAVTDNAAEMGVTAAVTPPPVAAGNESPYCNKYFGSGALVANLSTAADVYGAAIPWLGCGYTPQQIQAAYGLNKVGKFKGQGIKVAIVDAYASPTLQADANRYSANHKLPPMIVGVNFSQIIPAGIYNVSPAEPCGPYGWWGEQALDMSAVHGAAPGATIVYVGSRDCGTSLDIAFFNTIYNHVADVITDSWGVNGEAIAPGAQAAYDQAAMAAAVHGITVLFSSGDLGDLSAPNGVASGSWPATSNWVTGVGGTTLELMDSSGTKAEYGWGTYRASLTDVKVHSATSVSTSGVAMTSAFGVTFDAFSFYSGAGGGISLLESQPAYQAARVPSVLATSLNLASGFVETLPEAQRVSPDVAMVADPYTGYLVGQTYTIAGNPISDAGCKPISATQEYCEIAYGGTSLSSPLMAAVIAVVNQKHLATGEPRVGFANPLLYRLGSGGDGVHFTGAALNQIVAPPEAVSVLRGYAVDLTRARVIAINSVPFLITTAPYALQVCGLPVCLGVNEVFNYTSLASASFPPTPAGYNDVTGLGVPYLPKLIDVE